MKQSAMSGTRTSLSLLLVATVLVCLTWTTSSFCPQGKRSVPWTRNVRVIVGPTGLSPTSMSGDSSEEQDSSESEKEDAVALQKEIDEMFPGQKDEDEELNLYNAAPLFTGGIIMVVSMAATAYLFYAGLTGDDPLMGHPN